MPKIQAQLPKLLNPGFAPGEIPTGAVELDRNNHFGQHTTFAFFPGNYGPLNPAINTEHGPFISLGQKFSAIFEEDDTGTRTAAIDYEFDNTWGYRGLVANVNDQGSAGGFEYRFGSGADGQLAFPDRQRWTIWGLCKPLGNGSNGGTEDPRIFSRDNGTGTNNHYYMIGGVRSGGNVQARGRFKIGGGATSTVVVTGQNFQNDSLNFIAATYDGATLTIHHIREDGGYSSATSSESGDLSDSSTSTVGLALGGNYVSDNAFEGKIFGVGALDYPLSVDEIKVYARNVTQILKPANPMRMYIATSATGAQTIFPGFISSGSQAYAPTITTGAVNIDPPFISATSQVYTPTISATYNISPGFISGTSTTYAPTITTGAVNIDPPFISSTVQIYAPTITTGPQNIDAPFISSTSQVFAPEIVFDQIISPGFITGSSIVYAPTVVRDGDAVGKYNNQLRIMGFHIGL